MFTLFLFTLLFYGVDSICFLLFNTPYYFGKWEMYAILGFVGIVNYLLSFKNDKFLHYRNQQLHPLLTTMIIVIIFGGSLVLILYAGPRNLPIANISQGNKLRIFQI
ncbi:hypothetical protein [Edaphocola flava]|uniref:hypothetical protein n=1 Tax=Edaphocola flava TaxID=2499629 RepID=UPI00100A3807|nr:hypothetical protein [Edaphocola flava]